MASFTYCTFQFAYSLNSAITFFVEFPKGAVIGKSCTVVTLLASSRGWSSLRVLFSQTKKLDGSCLYWCKYVCDFDGARQCLKETFPDRKVWLPTRACVIFAVRLSKALKHAHSKRPSNLHLRAARFHWRLHLKIFTVLNIFFSIQHFWATLRLPWKTEFVRKFFAALNILYFSHSVFLSNLHLHWKPELPWIFSLYWNIFYHSGFFNNLRLPWNFSSLPLVRQWFCCACIFHIYQY